MKLRVTIRTPYRQAARLLAALAGAGISAGLCAQALKSGEQVYKETCFVCHSTGVEKAPKFGDKQA